MRMGANTVGNTKYKRKLADGKAACSERKRKRESFTNVKSSNELGNLLCVLRKYRDVLGDVGQGREEDQVERETFQIKRYWSKTTKTDNDDKRRKRVKE